MTDRAGDGGEGNVDVEDPRPRPLVDDDAADERAEERATDERQREVADVAAPLPRWQDVAQDGEGERLDCAASESLHRPRGDQLAHALRHAAEQRTDGE